MSEPTEEQMKALMLHNIAAVIENNSAAMAKALVPFSLSEMLEMEPPKEIYKNIVETCTRIMIVNKELAEELYDLYSVDFINELTKEEKKSLKKDVETSKLGQRIILIQTEGPRTKVERLEAEGKIKNERFS